MEPDELDEEEDQDPSDFDPDSAEQAEDYTGQVFSAEEIEEMLGDG